MTQILLLTPDLKDMGGVTNYYNTLGLHESPDIEVFFVNSAQKETSIDKIIRLIRRYIQFLLLLISKNFRIIHVNPSFDKKSFFRDAMFVFIGLLFKKKVLVFFRGWDETFEQSVHHSFLKKKIMNLTFGKCNNFIVLSQLFKNKIIALSPQLKNKNIWVETTVADDSFLPQLNLDHKLSSNEISFLFLSRIVKEKGIFIALEAYRLVKNKFPNLNLKLIIAGDGPALGEAKHFTKVNNIDAVEFTGYVLGEEKGKLLLQSKILIFPTFHGEGLPNTVLEAMLYGMPIISRINAGIPDVVEANINGFLTTHKDPEIFSSFMEKLILNKNLYEEMAMANHIKGKSLFTKTKVKARILEIYRQISKED